MLGKKLIQAASGNATGGGLSIEDVFSTWLYTGNGSTQTITNGIDLAGEGGMVWFKTRDNPISHALFDTSRGANRLLSSNGTSAETSTTGSTNFYSLSAFGATGFDLGPDQQLGWVNGSGAKFTSWTFRKAPGFFDVVTWTGDGSDPGMRIPHSLGSAPGCIIVKKVNAAGSWYVFHRSTGDLGYTILDNTGSANTLPAGYGWDVTATDFRATAGLGLSLSGATFVAYLFAHDEQIFGEGGDQSVIKCGSFTGSNFTVDLGWEPQWLLVKRSDNIGNWFLIDNMRGFPATGDAARLSANLANDEATAPFSITNTGFTYTSSTASYIYIAIRRGPMKTPTSGTEVFSLATAASYAANEIVPSSFPPDFSLSKTKAEIITAYAAARLTGGYLQTSSVASETAGVWKFDGPGGQVYTTSTYNTPIYWNFRRAPGFFDVVAYTGTGVARTVPHNLGVAPELMIVKQRNTTRDWNVYSSGVAAPATSLLRLNTTGAVITGVTQHWNSTAPTASVFSVAADFDVNQSGGTYIAYLFASCPGISKVGSYTGTGTTLNVDCGFTSGARFVLIKRTDSTGDWYVWDTARGIVSGNDSYLLLNSTAAEVTNTDYIDPLSSGFQITSTAPAAINASGGNFIFLAVA